MTKKRINTRSSPQEEQTEQTPPLESTQDAQAAMPTMNREDFDDFPVVGIGASAGGLKAFESFFEHVPPDSGMAFVLVQHLSAERESILDELIRRHTCLEVAEAKDGVEVLPDHVYIIPPGKDLALLHGRLHLMEPKRERIPHLPIDYFFRSLAQDQRERAIGIVLSGTGSDGTLGVKAIKEVGGMAMAHDPETAGYDGMPRSAIATGLVDYVLPPEEMPQQLMAYTQHAYNRRGEREAIVEKEPLSLLQKVFILLRSQMGHDFSSYKKSTIQRRVERRMAINQIESLGHYIRYLQQNPQEVELLFREFLITVTNFFRDPDAFAVLEEEVIPLLLEKPADQTVRVWVPGCATGEEAYSIAILLRERMESMKKTYKVQVFATDIDSEAIETARAGIYPDGIAADVSPERLARFFTQHDGAYQVTKTIRDMLIFAEQNVIADPPFSRIDLISCRNLMIYLESDLQKRILPLFHYALRPEGFLFLGTSESTGQFTDLFKIVDRKEKIFQRKDAATVYRPPIGFSALTSAVPAGPTGAREGDIMDREISFRELAERSLLAHYAPACAVVDGKGHVHYFHGRTGKYLEPAPGKATLNIMNMAREGLKLELTTAIRRTLDQEEPVHYRGIRVKTNGEEQPINLTVRRVEDPPSMQGLLIVIFEDVASDEEETIDTIDGPTEEKDRHIAQLTRELRAKEEYLQTTIEELETSNEELKSTNEELQSANEELQSTNEELETAKEEAQSVNEELVTVNAELEQKVEELRQANDDMKNLLAGTGVGTVFLDEHLNIQRFTPAAAEVMNLIQTDVGRPVSHITSSLIRYDGLEEDARQALETLVPQKRDVQTKEGDWYQVSIKPYRTLQNVIEGVVVTFVDITDLKRAEQAIAAARDYAQSIVETVREPLVILDSDLHVVSANLAFYQTFQLTPAAVEGVSLYHLADNQWDIPDLRTLLEEILPQETSFNDYKVEHNFPDIGHRVMLLNAREILREEDKQRLILLAIEVGE